MTLPTNGSGSVACTEIVSLARFAPVGGGARGFGRVDGGAPGGGSGLGQRGSRLLGLDRGDDGARGIEEAAGHALNVLGGDREERGRVAAVFVPAEAVALVEGQRRGQRGAALQRNFVGADEIALGALQLRLRDGLAHDARELLLDDAAGAPE